MASEPPSRSGAEHEVRVVRGDGSQRDVRPVVAVGLVAIAVLLAWPRKRHEPPVVRETPSEQRARDAGPGATARTFATGTRQGSGSAPAVGEVAATAAVGRAAPPPRPTPAAAHPTPPRAAAPETPPSTAASGIGLFPPPGTNPPKPGIIVPDDYELPPGYVRHYQTTDDGKQLAPILMFHPDFQPVDGAGNPIPLPADRVVPPSMAPPGLPLDMLEVPKTQVPFMESPPADADATR